MKAPCQQDIPWPASRTNLRPPTGKGRQAEALSGDIPDSSPGYGRGVSPHTRDEGRLLKEEVDEEDIAQVVSRWTGIPVSRLVEWEIEKLVRMEERLGGRGGGQGGAGRRAPQPRRGAPR